MVDAERQKQGEGIGLQFSQLYSGRLLMSQQHMIAGHVGGEIQVRNVQVNNETRQVASFSVAVNNRFDREAAPTWYRVSVWNGLASVTAQYVQKGSFVICIGSRLTASAWTNSENIPMATLELTADTLDFSANKRNDEQSASYDYAPPSTNPDEMPF
jgi:single stranded DNA-binding protein